MKLMPARVLAAGAAAAAIAAFAVPALSTAQTGGLQITVQEKIQKVQTDDIKPTSKSGRLSLGDRIVTSQKMFDAAKKHAGTLYTDCTSVGPLKPFPTATLLCTLTYVFANGQLVAAGELTLSGGGTVPIVGGTGAYATARGTVASAQPASGYDSADLITITG